MAMMNDFLGSLSQRSLNQARHDAPRIGDVQPRLASRFEPLTGTGPIVTTQADAIPQVEELLDAPMPARQRASFDEERGSGRLPRPTGDALPRENPIHRSARPDPTANGSPMIVPQSTVVIRETAQPPHEGVRPAISVTPDGLAQPRSSDKGPNIATPRESLNPPQAILEAIRHERVVERFVERERTLRLTQVEEGASPPRASRAGDQTSQSPAKATNFIKPKVEPLPAPIERRRSEASFPRSSIGGARESEAPAPIIQVTIGRIEVRATPPSAPVKRGSPPASTMSLEDYLRSRSGDRR
jgi:hypothetical protein